jgi:hypothetical protein
MLHRLLDNLQLLGRETSGAAASTNSSGSSSSTAAVAAEQLAPQLSPPLAIAAELQAAGTPSELVNMLEGACALLAGLAENMEQQQLLELPMMPALQVACRTVDVLRER